MDIDRNKWPLASVAIVTISLLMAPGVRAANFNVPSSPMLSLIHGSNSTTLTYLGQVNFQYVVYASTDLKTWSGLITNLCTASVMNFTETNRPNRCYKAVSLKTPLFYRCTFSGNEN